MNDCDLIVLDFLATHAGFTAQQICHLKACWESVRHGDEDLAQFLLGQQLLSGSAVQIFAQMGRHHLTELLGLALLDRRELQSLRRRLPDVALLADDKLSATVTLLNGDDTAKDSNPALELPPLAHADGHAHAEPELPRAGFVLGKYLLAEWVGHGSGSEVYRALHPTLQIPVAVKILHPTIEGDGIERARRLSAEARVLARLNHPNIVRVFDFEQDEYFAFLVLEYVNGPSLAELIEHSGRVQASRVVRIMRQLVDALAAAHKLGIVDRDIKPANVLLTRDGHVKLADLALALVPAPIGEAGA